MKVPNAPVGWWCLCAHTVLISFFVDGCAFLAQCIVKKSSANPWTSAPVPQHSSARHPNRLTMPQGTLGSLQLPLPWRVSTIAKTKTRKKPLTMFHLQTPKMGSGQPCLMNLGNVQLQRPLKSRVSARTWGSGET